MEDEEVDNCLYLPTEEEIEEALAPIRAKKIQAMRESHGQELAPKQHGRIIYLHHRCNGYTVYREE